MVYVFSSALSNLPAKIKKLALYNTAKRMVRHVTNNDVSFPSVEKLDQIARLTYDPIRFAGVMNALWKRLNGGCNSWRHILKALNLLEYLLNVGNWKIVDMCQDNVFLVCMLQTFQCMEGNIDRGQFIRNKADTVYRLINEPDFLAKQRELSIEKRDQILKSLKENNKTDFEVSHFNTLPQSNLNVSSVLPIISTNQPENNKPQISMDSHRLITIVEDPKVENSEENDNLVGDQSLLEDNPDLSSISNVQ